MAEINNGGPAFARDTKWDLDGAICQKGSSGMSLRDWFAGQALAGMLSRGMTEERDGPYLGRESYRISDAMLAERNK